MEFKTADEAYLAGYEQGRTYERANTIDEVMEIVKEKISEKEYLMDTMVELTDLGARIQRLKEQSYE